mmetsp:Transcript_37717/g.69789  ORF Transcript_37717/g.69789 Transcript_37717/m.69789 type:complete len:357 (+) Transcript_37717:3-1073(+)
MIIMRVLSSLCVALMTMLDYLPFLAELNVFYDYFVSQELFLLLPGLHLSLLFFLSNLQCLKLLQTDLYQLLSLTFSLLLERYNICFGFCFQGRRFLNQSRSLRFRLRLASCRFLLQLCSLGLGSLLRFSGRLLFLQQLRLLLLRLLGKLTGRGDDTLLFGFSFLSHIFLESSQPFGFCFQLCSSCCLRADFSLFLPLCLHSSGHRLPLEIFSFFGYPLCFRLGFGFPCLSLGSSSLQRLHVGCGLLCKRPSIFLGLHLHTSSLGHQLLSFCLCLHPHFPSLGFCLCLQHCTPPLSFLLGFLGLLFVYLGLSFVDINHLPLLFLPRTGFSLVASVSIGAAGHCDTHTSTTRGNSKIQ